MKNNPASAANMSIKAGKLLTFSLWGINLASISACTFCYIYLSYYVYRASSRMALSELILFAPMLLPVVLVWQIHRLSNCVSPRTLMLTSNLLGLVCCVLMFSFLPESPWFALPGIVVIGALDSVQRVSRIVAIKTYFHSDQVKTTVPLTLTAQFVAGGLAGGLLSIFRQSVAPRHALFITCSLFAVAAGCALLLPQTRTAKLNLNQATKEPAAWRQVVAVISTNRPLQQHFFAFVLLITFFQGFFNVSRVALPAQKLDLPESYVGLLQVVNSGAALAGALLFYWGSRKKWTFPVQPLRALSAVAMIGACVGTNVIGSYTLYFLYIFFFELVFFRMQAEIVANCPAESMPLVATIQYAAVYAGMMLAILAGAVMLDKVGLATSAAVFATIYFFLDVLRQQWTGKLEIDSQGPLVP